MQQQENTIYTDLGNIEKQIKIKDLENSKHHWYMEVMGF